MSGPRSMQSREVAIPCLSPDHLQPWPVSCMLLKRSGPCGGAGCNQILAACMYMYCIKVNKEECGQVPIFA